MNNLAYTYKLQSRSDEAIELMKEVVERRTRVFGANHHKTLKSAKLLSYWTQG